MFFLCCLFGFARCPQFELWTPIAGDIAQDGQAVRQSATTLDRWPQHGLHEPSTGWCHPDLKEMPYVSVCLWLLSWCWKTFAGSSQNDGTLSNSLGKLGGLIQNGNIWPPIHLDGMEMNCTISDPEVREKNRYKLLDFPMKPQDDEIWKPSKKKSHNTMLAAGVYKE